MHRLRKCGRLLTLSVLVMTPILSGCVTTKTPTSAIEPASVCAGWPCVSYSRNDTDTTIKEVRSSMAARDAVCPPCPTYKIGDWEKAPSVFAR